MRWGILFTALVGAALPLQAGVLFTVDSMLDTPTNAGTYPGGIPLYITVAGTVNLSSPSGLIVTNPDGSLATSVPPASCIPCWAPGYQYFIPGSNTYPVIAGNGDGTNHFSGGGGNYDLFPGSHSPWAPEGKPTTDTTDPGTLRFGSLAATFTPSPTATDWFLLGYGGIIVTPAGGGTLMLVIPDAYYINNAGAFTVNVDLVPEPTPLWLAFSGFAVLGLPRLFRRLSRKS